MYSQLGYLIKALKETNERDEDISVILLLPSFVNANVAADQDNVPDPSVVNCVPALPSAVGNTYATEAVLLPALKPV